MAVISFPCNGIRNYQTVCLSGVSTLVFLVAKLKPLVDKQNRASLARGAVINFSIPKAPYQLKSLDHFSLLKSGIHYSGC